MKVEILYHPGDANYSWKLYTGPDGIDFYNGLASSLGNALRRLSNTKSGMVWIIVVKNYEYKNQSRNDCG
jgi:hypothetical protein